MSRPSLVVCDECGWFGVGVVYDDKVVPTGVGACPDCGNKEWREFDGE